MYDLPYHKDTDAGAVRAFMEEHPFVLLTGCDAEGRPVATQVPVFVDEGEGGLLLRGHMMRGTDHHHAFELNDAVLAVFTGHHVYVSGTWYSDPHTPSTWNYMSVHAKGRIRFLEDEALEEMLRRTSLHFEGDDPDSPTTYDQLPSDLTRWALRAIVGFEIVVTELDHVFKLSQDRDRASYLNIIQMLKDRGEAGRAISAEMEKRLEQVFPAERDD